ncbi:MAG TPA: ABC transporter ATP-binding protein [Candidatus Micrarchaeia archaeon]|nr:ABC transporter ATP-binding protein [Candidatus Micrarchaeia archaeon]
MSAVSGGGDPAPAGMGPPPPVLVAEGLEKTYRISRQPRAVLAGVSLAVRRGELVAVMGPSGCGKSTLLHVLGGLELPDRGTVAVAGIDLYALDDRHRAAFRRRRVGFVFQFFNLLPSLTAAQNVSLPLELGARGGWPWRRRADPATARRVQELMASLGLHGLQGRRPDEISGGERQRVAIARALLTRPDLLLADEPTGTLDHHAAGEVLELLLQLTEQQAQTILVVTHDLRTAAYADRVLLMRDGRLIEEVILGRRVHHDTAPLLGRLAAQGL